MPPSSASTCGGRTVCQQQHGRAWFGAVTGGGECQDKSHQFPHREPVVLAHGSMVPARLMSAARRWTHCSQRRGGLPHQPQRHRTDKHGLGGRATGFYSRIKSWVPSQAQVLGNTLRSIYNQVETVSASSMRMQSPFILIGSRKQFGESWRAPSRMAIKPTWIT